MQGDGQFDHAKAGTKVSAGTRDRFNQVVAQLAGDLGQGVLVEAAQVGRRIDTGQVRIAGTVDHYGHEEKLAAIFSQHGRRGKETTRAMVGRSAGDSVCELHAARFLRQVMGEEFHLVGQDVAV